MVSQEALAAAAAQIRSHGAVAVLGAGLSAERYPMTPQLLSLLWHALDSDRDARSSLADELGREDGPAKSLICDDPAAVMAAWRCLEYKPSVRDAFQRAFVELDADREPTPAHYALARLIHADLIEYVISFNWDTALERAYEQLYGVSLRGQRPDLLAKPHGDAAQADTPWVLPHEAGVVPPEVLDRVATMSTERPRVLLVVGYSGSDEAVVQQLLEPTRERWPVIEVAPSASGAEDVAGTADNVLPALADLLHAIVDNPGWRWVSFGRTRDMRAALLGYRLGPQDVQACPELPASRAIAERLQQTRFSVLVGDSGSGKSITAFQAAALLNQAGWSVTELSQPGVATAETVRAFTTMPGPVLAVVDDAQALAPDVIHALERAVADDHAVLIVATERPAGPERVRLVTQQAVATLIRYCEENREVVEPLLREVDDRVGEGWQLESFEWRLDAARSSEFPWQFMFVLSGGERRIAETLAVLAEENDSDLAFVVLGASQLLSLDTGLTRDEIASLLGPFGRDPGWLDQALGQLSAHRLVVARDGRLRTPHLRIANRGLLLLCQNVDHAAAPAIRDFIRSRLLDPTEPLQGRLWLLRALDPSEALRYGSKHGRLLDEQVAAALLDACLAAPAGRERSIAAYLMWEVHRYHALFRTLAERVAEVLPGWIGEATSEDVYGLAWLLGGLRSDYIDIHGAIGSQVTPELIAARLSEHGQAGSGEWWGRLVRELAPADGDDTEDWAGRFGAAFDHEQVATWAGDAADLAELRGGVELADDLAFLAPRTAATIITALTPALADQLARNAADAAQVLVPWAFSVFPILGTQDDEFFEQNLDTFGVLRDAVSALVDAADWTQAGASLSRARLYELDQLYLLTFSLKEFAPDALARMLAAVPLDALDRITEGHWSDFSGITDLVHALAQGDEYEPARSWVERHRDEITTMPTMLVPVAPRVAVDVVARGGDVRLEPQGGLRWQWCSEALTALMSVDEAAARTVVDASRAAIMNGFALAQSNMTEHLPEFIAVLDALDSQLVTGILDQAETVTTYETNWTDRLGGNGTERTAASILIERAAQASGPIRDVADHLRGRLDDANAAPS